MQLGVQGSRCTGKGASKERQSCGDTRKGKHTVKQRERERERAEERERAREREQDRAEERERERESEPFACMHACMHACMFIYIHTSTQRVCRVYHHYAMQWQALLHMRCWGPEGYGFGFRPCDRTL